MADPLDFELSSSSSDDDDDELPSLNLQSAPSPSPPTPTPMDIQLPERISPLPPTPEPPLFQPVSPPMPVASPPAKILKPTPRSIVQVAPARARPAKIPLVSASDYKSRQKRLATSPLRHSTPPTSPVSRPKPPTSPVSRPKPSTVSKPKSSTLSRPKPSKSPISWPKPSTVSKPSTSHSAPPRTQDSGQRPRMASTSHVSRSVKTLPPSKPSCSYDARPTSPPPAFPDRHESPETYHPRRKVHFAARHARTFGVLCMRNDGHTLTNGYLYHSVDGPIRPQVLLEQLYELRVNFLVFTDAITKSKWDDVLARLPPFHPALEFKTVVLRPDANGPLGRCVYCSQEHCHRWIAVIGGISKFLHISMEPIPHRN